MWLPRFAAHFLPPVLAAFADGLEFQAAFDEFYFDDVDHLECFASALANQREGHEAIGIF